MLIYEGTKANFLLSVEQDTIAVEIENNIYERMHRHTAKMNSVPGRIPWNICIRF